MKYQTKLFLTMSIMLTIVSSAATGLFYQRARESQFEGLRARLISIATTAAMLVPAEKLEQLNTPADESRPEYAEVREILRGVMRNPEVRGIYTMRRGPSPDVFEFIVDPGEDVDDNKNGLLEPGERYPRVGEPYRVDGFPEMKSAFEGPTADRLVTSDRWGEWLSAYAPIYDDQNRPVAILGIDMAAGDVEKEARGLVRLTAVILLFGISAAFVVSWIVSRRLVRPLEVLAGGLSEVASGNLDVTIDVRGRDEIGRVGAVFNDMVQTLADARKIIEEQNRTLEERVAQKTQELQRTREAAIESEKLAALGTFAGGIAHEFNNIICALQGQVELAALSPTPEKIQKAADTVAACAERSRRITDALQTFTRRGPLRLQPTDIEQAVETALDLFKGDFNTHNISVTRKFSEVEMIGAEPERLVQAFASIIGNARDAMMEHGGRLTVIIRPVDEDIEVAVRDTGHGIDVSALPHLFEPFFTTKAPTGPDLRPGAGLGLAAAHGIITSHGGSITAENNEEGGATIRVTLPVRAWAGKGRRPVTPRPALESRRVLIVDDEPDIRTAVEEILGMKGWDVDTAATGLDALEKASARAFPLYLVDIAIPGMNGIELIQRLRELTPEAVFVVMSGFAQEQLVPKIGEGVISAFIPKPFTTQEVVTTLEALAQPRTRATTDGPARESSGAE